MGETFYFDFFQIPQVGVDEPDMDAQTRTDVNIPIRRPVDMKISNFGAYSVGARLSNDYTRINLGFKSKDELSDWNVMAQDTGVGSNVAGRGVTVIHNPLLAGSSLKYTRDDQFIRMTMSRNTDETNVDPPKFDVMDEKVSTAAGINATANGGIKNWPAEGWRSFGGKYDFLPYVGGTLK